MECIRSKEVRIRKERYCSACLNKQGKGTTMQSSTIVDYGSIWRYDTCKTCTALMHKYPKYFSDCYGIYDEGCVNDRYPEGIKTPEEMMNHLDALKVIAS